MPARIGPFQKAYIEWLCTPSELRDPADPQNDREWSAANNIATKQMRNWRRSPEFQREWQKALAKRRVTPDRLDEVYEALFERAKSGDTRAAKLYLESNGRLNPPAELLDDAPTALSEMSDEDLERLHREAIEAELERRASDPS